MRFSLSTAIGRKNAGKTFDNDLDRIPDFRHKQIHINLSEDRGAAAELTMDNFMNS